MNTGVSRACHVTQCKGSMCSCHKILAGQAAVRVPVRVRMSKPYASHNTLKGESIYCLCAILMYMRVVVV